MIRFFQKVYLYYGFFIFGLFMLMVFPIVGIAHYTLPRKAQEFVKLLCMKFWACSFYTFGIWFIHKGTSRAQKNWPEGPLIIVCNHNSLLDTPAVYLSLHRFALPLAKIELTKMPVFGHLNQWITLPVNRRSTKSRHSSMTEMANYLNKGGSLLIFPEGQTNKSRQLLQPFESGAFRLGFELGIPIATLLVRNTKYCLAGTSPMILRPGLITTEAGPVFYGKDYSDALQFQKTVFNWYETRLAQKII